MHKVRHGVMVVMLLLGSALAQQADAGRQPLKVWTSWQGEELAWLESQLASFSQNFAVPIALESHDVSQSKQAWLLGLDDAPVLVIPMAHEQLPELAAGGHLLDFMPLSTQGYRQGFAEQARVALSYPQVSRGDRSALFGLPLYLEGPALIRNTNLMPALAPDFTNFIRDAQALNQGSLGQGNSSEEDITGFLYDIGNFYFSYVWLASNGGYIFANEGASSWNAQDIGLNTNQAVAGARQLQALRYQHDLIPNGIDYSFADDAFAAGRLAAIYNGPWALPRYQAAGIPMQVSAIPSDTQDPLRGFLGVYAVVVYAKHPQALRAVDLAKWLSRPEALAALSQQGAKIPASQAAVTLRDDALVEGFYNVLRQAEPMPTIPDMGNVWGPMSDALSLILADEHADVQHILDKAVQAIQQGAAPPVLDD